ncbi:MAG: hypothetical protein AMJ88_04935 [Anaerolineae bacterium SM23_ 63]|nr:MAG: hypothetical protein AMJ88_04935 [Anaerolineae bacterium SM23_ 63]HEY46763.1 GNAT family N-acetyltransferase [Anaerolineae bacterium]
MISSPEFEGLSKLGFTARPATMADLSAVIDLLNACSLASIGVPQFNEDETLIIWENPSFNMETDTRIILSPQGELIGYIDVTRLTDPPVHPLIWGQVHPEWERQGIGTALMSWALARARVATASVPDGIRVSMMTYTPSTHQPTKALFENFKMKPIRHNWRMVLDLDDAPVAPVWPQGIALQRYIHPQDAEAVYRVEDQIFRDSRGHIQEPFESGFKRWLHHATGRSDFDPSLWTLAMDDEEIVGLIRCRPADDSDPETGWISVLGVCRRWRGRGLGLALLQHAFGEFRRRGKMRAGLSVDAENITGASRLYEKAGMQIERENLIYELELKPGREITTQVIPR